MQMARTQAVEGEPEPTTRMSTSARITRENSAAQHGQWPISCSSAVRPLEPGHRLAILVWAMSQATLSTFLRAI